MNILIKSTLAIAITSLLAACGSDSDSTSSKSVIPPVIKPPAVVPPVVVPPVVIPPKPNEQLLTATLIGSDMFTWEQGKPINIQLLDQNNKAIKATKCVSDDKVKLTVSANCSALTTHRLGQSTLTVTSANNITTKLTVNSVPTKTPLAVNAGGNNGTNRIVTANGQVLTWGTNYHNQLSTIDTNKVDYLQYPKPVVTNAKGDKLGNIYQVAHSGSTAYALTKEGTVYGWGSGVDNSTVSNNSNVVFAEPVQDATARKPLTNIARLASASQGNQVMGLTDEGKVLRWGSSDAYHPEYQVDNNGKPIEDIISIALEYTMAYAVNSKGQVYQWDLDPNANIHPVSLVKDKSGTPISGIKKIITNDTHTLALTKSGNVYAWGDNNSALGDEDLENTGTRIINYANYVKLGATPLGNIKDIAMNFSASYALTQSGNVYAWGSRGFGELGDGVNKPSGGGTAIPGLVVSESGQGVLSNVVAITGMNSGALALKSNGTIVGWGRNWHGLLTQDNPEGVDEYRYPVLMQQSKDKVLNVGDMSAFTMLNY